MVVQHNLSAMNSNRMLGITAKAVSTSTEKLSSGYQINRAADNAAGLAISEKMRKQIRGLTQASANAEDGISSVQTAEGALTEVHDMLQRMNELAVQAANGTNSEDDRSYIQDEIDQLTQEIDRVAETTKFNETYLLKGDTKNADAMGYTYTYKAVDAKTATIATAKMTKAEDTAHGMSVTISFAECSSKVSSSDSNNLAKAIRDQGFTISTATVSGQAVYSLELNGSDAKSNYKVVTVSAAIGHFVIKNANGATVATVTVTTGTSNTAGQTVAQAGLTAGKSQIVTAYSVSAAYAKGDVYSVYDKDGNAISANKLSQYFTAGEKEGTTVAPGGAATSISANSGVPKIYDVLGKEISAVSVADKNMVSAVKDQTATLKMSFHVGADGTANNKININIDAMNSKSLGVNGLKVNGSDGTKATDAIETIAAAIKKVSTQRSALGAVQNRLEHTIKNLDNIVENTTSAESAIRDTDMATEMVKFSNANILSQAGQSMLAQANQSNQGVLSILG
ncbi:MAG: flagellar hook protein [Lachnospiraceae bacterium]|nr:flagellar hook protein [Lachnospiraceae bacterium]